MLSVQRKTPMVDQVYSLLNMVWKTYHFSSKSMRELRALGVELGVRVSVPSGVSGTHWLPHVSCALQTLLKPGGGGRDHQLQNPEQFTAVYYHMDHLSASSANADVAGRARKIKKMMEDGTFVAFCHFLADLFDAISKFSLLLQRNDVILPQVTLKLHYIVLLYEDLTPTAKAVRSFKIFSHDSWPEQRDQLIDYGGEELDFLLDHFSTVLTRNGCDINLAREEYQSMKMFIASNYMDKSYHSLWEMMLTKEPYISDYKRRIKSDVRGSLHVDTVEDLIRISLEGPSLEEFDAKEAVQMWFSQSKRARRPNYKGWPTEVPSHSGPQEVEF
ncbi:hypothetical protein ABVT39_014679 [Epinephelus coioides]